MLYTVQQIQINVNLEIYFIIYLFMIFTVIYSSKRLDDRANVLALKSVFRDANFTECEDVHCWFHLCIRRNVPFISKT